MWNKHEGQILIIHVLFHFERSSYCVFYDKLNNFPHHITVNTWYNMYLMIATKTTSQDLAGTRSPMLALISFTYDQPENEDPMSISFTVVEY